MMPPSQQNQPYLLTGQPQPAGMMATTTVIMPSSNGSATWGMILGIISMIISVVGGPFSGGLCCFISLPIAFIGMILSHIGSSAAKNSGVGRGEATAGLVLNWLQLLVIVIGIVAFFVFGAAVYAGI